MNRLELVLLLIWATQLAAIGGPPAASTPHPRAVAADARMRPALERDLKAAGLEFGAPVFIRAFKEERVLEFFIQNRRSGKFDLFAERMKRTVGSAWEAFWKNLKEGYDIFEKTRIPPEVSVRHGRYDFLSTSKPAP